MINSPAAEYILSELENPNLFADEREALQILAALLEAKWKSENDKTELAAAA